MATHSSILAWRIFNSNIHVPLSLPQYKKQNSICIFTSSCAPTSPEVTVTLDLVFILSLLFFIVYPNVYICIYISLHKRSFCACSVSSVMSDSVLSYGLQPAWLLCPWDSPRKNTGVGCCAFLQGIFLTQGLNLHLLRLLNCRQILYPLNHLFSSVQWLSHV